MGKAQSKRSVDITTETKKGTEDEFTEKMEKIEDLDKKEVLNGDATISEKSDLEKKDTEDLENDKDLTTEKDNDIKASGDAAEPQSVEASKDEGGPATAEEISPLADGSIKKSKKEKVKKKWSFRSISFGKKDKQKPTKSEDAAEDAAANGVDVDEKTINEPENTQKNKTGNENQESHENGNATPQELNGAEQSEEQPSDDKSNDNTAIKNTTTTETCESVQNDTADVSSEIHAKTENTVVFNETKIFENATVDATKNVNGTDEKINATNHEPKITDVTNASVETSSDKTTILASAITNESPATTNGQVVDQIHQNGNHGESEQDAVEISKAQIEVNSNTDNKASAAILDSISSTSINPSNVQIHAQILNTPSEKLNEVVEINIDESAVQKCSANEINRRTVDQSSLSEILSMVKDVEDKVQIDTSPKLKADVMVNENSSGEKLDVNPSPPPLPISQPPSQFSVFAFTSNNETTEDSIQNKNFEPPMKVVQREIPLLLSELPVTEIIKGQETRTYEQADTDEVNTNVQCLEESKDEEKEETICRVLKKDIEEPSCHFEKLQIGEEASVAVAVTVIDEITETAEVVNKKLKCNEEETTELPSQSCEEREEVKKENIIILCNGKNKAQNAENQVDDEEFVCDVPISSHEISLVTKQSDNITIQRSLDFTPCETIQDHDEMNSLEKSDNLDEKHLDLSKQEFVTTKDVKDNITVAEITQELSVTCE